MRMLPFLEASQMQRRISGRSLMVIPRDQAMFLNATRSVGFKLNPGNVLQICKKRKNHGP